MADGIRVVKGLKRLTGILPTFYRKVMSGWYLKRDAYGEKRKKPEKGRTLGSSPGDNAMS